MIPKGFGLFQRHFLVQVPYKPSPKTAKRMLTSAGLYSCWAARKPLLSTMNIRKRLNFAENHTMMDWNRVIFCDEKMFRIRPGGRIRCWRRRGDRFCVFCVFILFHLSFIAYRYKAKYVVPTTQRPVGVMVWCAIDGKGNVCLRRCDATMDSEAYINLLKSAESFVNRRCTCLG